ncbi:hypothetical protein L873DRAFT_1806100 [Choiromyces venosus 120613-1]|uniref:Uncharacterized protein n=1 Tax=Choiromyces venosus 120613-1 TaxID=1336337 RepID=A0A3N4K207_9PEZI|nr:hypothetical protein L873DRAFT_1806100 [Choiromyces venosus 120613-1]
MADTLSIGDTSGLLCFLLFFLALGGLSPRARLLDSISVGGWQVIQIQILLFSRWILLL